VRSRRVARPRNSSRAGIPRRKGLHRGAHINPPGSVTDIQGSVAYLSPATRCRGPNALPVKTEFRMPIWPRRNVVPPVRLDERPHTSGTRPMFIASCEDWGQRRDAGIHRKHASDSIGIAGAPVPSLENADSATRFRIIEVHAGPLDSIVSATRAVSPRAEEVRTAGLERKASQHIPRGFANGFARMHDAGLRLSLK